MVLPRSKIATSILLDLLHHGDAISQKQESHLRHLRAPMPSRKILDEVIIPRACKNMTGKGLSALKFSKLLIVRYREICLGDKTTLQHAEERSTCQE